MLSSLVWVSSNFFMELSIFEVDSLTVVTDVSTASTLLLMLVNLVSNSDRRAEVAALTCVSINALTSGGFGTAVLVGGGGLFFIPSMVDSIVCKRFVNSVMLLASLLGVVCWTHGFDGGLGLGGG